MSQNPPDTSLFPPLCFGASWGRGAGWCVPGHPRRARTAFPWGADCPAVVKHPRTRFLSYYLTLSTSSSHPTFLSQKKRSEKSRSILDRRPKARSSRAITRNWVCKENWGGRQKFPAWMCPRGPLWPLFLFLEKLGPSTWGSLSKVTQVDGGRVRASSVWPSVWSEAENDPENGFKCMFLGLHIFHSSGVHEGSRNWIWNLLSW